MKTNAQCWKSIAVLAIGTAGLAISGSSYSDQSGDKTLSGSERMIARCLDYAAIHKLPPLSIGVVDQSGALITFKRQDGASSSTTEAALLKARTALRVNAPTAALTELDASTRDAFLLMQMTTLPGGVPFVHDDGRTVGAVGVSGGYPDQDAECARLAASESSAGH